MLQSIRDRSQGWLTWLIVIVICTMFALWGVSYYLTGSGSSEEIVAKVNGVKITARDLAIAYQQISQGQQGNVDSNTIRQLALDSVIDKQVLTQAAEKAKFTVSQAQVDSMLLSMPAFQDNGQFSAERYQAVLQMLGMTPEQLQQDATNSMLREQVRFGLMDSAFVLPNEVNDIVALASQQRDIGYFSINPNTFASKVKVTDTQISQYYQAHQADFMVPEQVKVDYILLSKADLAKKQTVSDAEIQAYYQQNQYKQPLASVKDKIIAAIQQQKADQAYAQIGSQLSTLAYENPNSLNFVAQQLGLTVQQTGLFSQAGAKTGIAANQQVVSVAFSDNVLKQGNNSDIINLSDDQAVIIRLNQDVPAAPQPLSQVKAQINTLLVQQAARELALQQAVAIETALQQGKDVASIAKQYGLSWQQKANLSHDDKTANTDLLSAVFSVPRPVAGHPAVDVANLKNGDILVFSVVKVHNPSSPSPELLGVYTKLLQPMMAQFMYEQYLSALKAHADIEVLEK